MEKIQRILVATDFSPRADRAVQRAAQLAMEHSAYLYLLHVLPVFPLEALKRVMVDTPLETEQRLYNEAEATLQTMAAELTGKIVGVHVRYHVAIGRTHVEINHYAETHRADLIVIGNQGETFLQEFFLGTTASKTLQKGCHPLLIIKQAPKRQYKHVLVPLDFSQPSVDALKVALKVVTDASIHVLHVVEMPYKRKMNQPDFNTEWADLYRDKTLSRALEVAEKIVSDCAPGDPRVRCIIEHGSPHAVIRDKAHSLGIDLIVIGKRGETELDEALFGSVTKHVLYETPCDVFVVSPEKQAIGRARG
ncbi:MAG: universal stress protein [Nitrosospira sp.]|nr:universal stress protein [Nitrosospira sp.]